MASNTTKEKLKFNKIMLQETQEIQRIKAVKRAFEPQEIIKVVCEVTGYSFEQINVKTRKTEIVKTRYTCFYFLHKYTKLSYNSIGKQFLVVAKEGMNHSSIIHGLKDYIDNFYRRDRKSMEVMRLHRIIENKLNNYFESLITPEEATEKAIKEYNPGLDRESFFQLVSILPSQTVSDVISRACIIYAENK